MERNEPKLCIVKWRDVIATNEWEKDIDCPVLYSVGWLLSEDKTTVKIGNTVDYDDFSGESKEDVPILYGLHAFPRGCVESITFVDSMPLREGSPTSPLGANLTMIHTQDSATSGNV